MTPATVLRRLARREKRNQRADGRDRRFRATTAITLKIWVFYS
jgi:hypothetical protein